MSLCKKETLPTFSLCRDGYIPRHEDTEHKHTLNLIGTTREEHSQNLWFLPLIKEVQISFILSL